MLSYIVWDFDPAIFSIGEREIRYYGLLWATSFWVGYLLVKKMFQIEKRDESHLDPLLYTIIIGAIGGARLGHVFFYDWPYYSKHLIEILFIWEGGLASHGGITGVILGLLWFSYKKNYKFWYLADKIALPAVLSGFFIRLGNFFNSEINGDPTDLPWGVVFKRVGEDFPRHPAQLYESFCYLLIFSILMYLYFKKNLWLKDGKLFGLAILLVFIVRFLIEFVKESQAGIESSFGNILSTGQLLSIPFIIAGLYLFLRKTNEVKA